LAALIVVAGLVGCGDNGLGTRDGGNVIDDADVDAGMDGPVDAPTDASIDAPPRCGDGHVDPGEACDGVEGLSGDGCSSTCTTESITWTNLTPNPVPARWEHAMAYDSVRNRLVVFGGLTGVAGTPSNETWEWDGTTWTQRLTLVTPAARNGHAMVFDAARQRVVMFGGDGGAGYLNDTWEWDGTTWTQRSPTTSPPPTAHHYMAYDAMRAVTVMCSSSTWEWDGTAWTQVAPSVPFVPTFSGHTDLAYAGAAGVMLLGDGTNWLWNGTTWTSASFTADVPWTSLPVFATYDELRDRVIAVGYQQSPADRSSVWEWVNGNWQERPGSEPDVPHWMITDVAYDPDDAVVWLFGGRRHTWISAELWEWNGTRWREHYKSVPSPRGLPLLTFDARRARVVMFGGYGRGPVRGDTWEWDGAAWSLRATSGPPPRGDHGLTYDERRGKVVLFGGIDLDHLDTVSAPVPLSDLWEWDGSSWQQKTATPSPIGTYSAATAYDRARGYTLVVTNGQTWTWDGAAWTLLQPSLQPPVPSWSMTAMAYDARRGVTVLYALYRDTTTATDVSEVWEWNGVDWTAKGTAPTGYRLFYDPLRARVILVELRYQGEQHGAWSWDGATWTQMPSAADRIGPNFVFDRANQRWFSFGGASDWDTWTATSGANDPREQCDGTDADGDLLTRCADPDCWWRCDPVCAPGDIACDPNRPRCGDGTCSSIESAALCPADCP
jgi:cysteine-rich repeat protein